MNLFNSKALLFITGMILTFLAAEVYGRTIYVDDDASGVNDGTSWENAYNYLQDALAVALDGDQIMVAEGIYCPDLGRGHVISDRTANFSLNVGVTITGGYAGFGAPSPDARDIQLHHTILSGDLNGDDVEVADPCDMINEPTRADNSYHVMIIDANIIMEGLIITGGNADGTGPGSTTSAGGGIINYGSPTLIDCTVSCNSASGPNGGCGGGMSISSGNPTLTNCIFSMNAVVSSNLSSGIYGGGVYNYNSSPILTDCTFNRNWAGRSGGGMFNATESCRPTLSDCIFSENSSEEAGGGICTESGSLTVNTCVFTNNNTGIYGGGIANHHQAEGTISDCVFTGNVSNNGGAVSNNNESNVTYINCVFNANTSMNLGGGMYNDFNGNAMLIDCKFIDNDGGGGGGGIMNQRGGSATATNCIFSGNQANHGGGIFSQQAEHPTTMTNCLFNDNFSSVRGGGICNYDAIVLASNCTFCNNYTNDSVGGGICNGNSELVVSNCILWNNTATGDQIEMAQIINRDAATWLVDYSCIQGLTGELGGTENIGDDPLFVDSSNDDYHLFEESPCIDAGDNSALPEWIETDLDGNVRILNDTIDMGVYEFGSPPPPESYYVGQVTSSEDDGYAIREEIHSLENPILRIGHSSFNSPPYYMSGMVFRNIDIPQGAEIISTHLKVQSYSSDITGHVYCTIQVEANDDAIEFDSSNKIDSRPTTDSSVDWNLIEPWSQYTWYESPDIAAVIQEVIDRNGWDAGNSLVIIISTRLEESSYRSLCSFDYNSDSAPQLEITYVP